MRKNIVSIIKDCWGIFYRIVVATLDKKKSLRIIKRVSSVFTSQNVKEFLSDNLHSVLCGLRNALKFAFVQGWSIVLRSTDDDFDFVGQILLVINTLFLCCALVHSRGMHNWWCGQAPVKSYFSVSMWTSNLLLYLCTITHHSSLINFKH